MQYKLPFITNKITLKKYIYLKIIKISCIGNEIKTNLHYNDIMQI